jgi:hypothetical protein
MIEVTVTVSGVNYSAVIGDGQERSDGAPMVSISRNGVWAGAGWWGGQRIEDCAADLGGEAYVAIDAAIVKAFDSDMEAIVTDVETERGIVRGIDLGSIGQQTDRDGEDRSDYRADLAARVKAAGWQEKCHSMVSNNEFVRRYYIGLSGR